MNQPAPSPSGAEEAQLLEQVLELLRSGLVLLDQTDANIAAAHLDASIVDIQDRLQTLRP